MRLFFQRGLIALLLLGTISLRAADVLTWHTNENLVSADIQSAELRHVLEGVAKLTGWHVYLESNITLNVSVKFKDLSSGDALHFLLRDLNYALVPQTNSAARLFVFRTTRANATQQIQPADLVSGKKMDMHKIPNELIVRLKPGVNIDELAKKLGAKVIGKIDGLNAYRLQFPDEAATAAALAQLTGNSDVASVENNYYVDQPPTAARLDSANGAPSPVQLKLSPPGADGRVIVGLIDTAVQPTGGDLDKFLLGHTSVAGDAVYDPNNPTHGPFMFQDILRGVASTSGGSSSVQVYSVDVYGPNATANTFDVAAGIAVAINNGANVINLSLGSSGDSQILHDIIQQATAKGFPVFAAAGNDATSQAFYPAAYPEVISVTAGSNGQLASYANYAAYIKLMLPGTAVGYFNNSPYLVSGTSTSSALASGLAAGTAGAKQISPGTAAGALLNTPTFQFKPLK